MKAKIIREELDRFSKSLKIDPDIKYPEHQEIRELLEKENKQSTRYRKIPDAIIY